MSWWRGNPTNEQWLAFHDPDDGAGWQWYWRGGDKANAPRLADLLAEDWEVKP
jgi:hypothetical protein